MSESAVSAKRGLGLCLARNRRSPKRPSEPRPSGVHPKRAQWKKSSRRAPLGCIEMRRLRTVGTNGDPDGVADLIGKVWRALTEKGKAIQVLFLALDKRQKSDITWPC